MTLPLNAAIDLVRRTPGYQKIGVELAQLASDGRIRFDAKMEDRAQTALSGIITLGEEATSSSALSLAQTLVHERYHLHQNPLLKTVSFWGGIVSRTPVMARYEKPAYRAAYNFLEAAKKAHLHLAGEAQSEQNAIAQVYETSFGAPLI